MEVIGTIAMAMIGLVVIPALIQHITTTDHND